MRISEFDYCLPDDLIAQQPNARRDDSRMLVVNRSEQIWFDCSFKELASHLRTGDLLVVNNTRVFPARLLGKKITTGANVELLLVAEESSGYWITLAKPARRLQIGTKVAFGNGRLVAEVIDIREEGRRLVRFACDGPLEDLIDEIGQIPLPPYIKRSATDDDTDRKRYQTVYARERGAIAAPTAGLHFTPSAMDLLKKAGVEIVEITLHVGYGTFEPVRVEDLDLHKVAPERISISTDASERINQARAEQRRIVAVGTTTTRALESSVDHLDRVMATNRMAELTITPGYRFRVVDALITNFHLPKSSLLVVVCAFAGKELTLNAYRHAIESRYRFYSYGDCMLIV